MYSVLEIIRMKKILLFIMAFTFIFIISGCGNKQETKADKIVNTKYDFMSYASDEIKDIEQIDLDSSLNDSCVSYKFTYMSDNNEVKAYISIPLSCMEEEKPYKCILYNRGGNTNIGLLGDYDTANICKATNRVVIASQYRGTDGGTGTDEFGGKDLDDIIKLIDFSENNFLFVSMDDYCTVGVSRGGMMSYMASQQDKRIKKIIAISAVSDLFQTYNDREDMQKILYNYIGGTPEDIPQEYENRSANYWAENITVPVMIIHSKNDKQVSYSQAEKLHNLFVKNGKKCSFIGRDDDIHGLSKDDAKPILEWLNDN